MLLPKYLVKFGTNWFVVFEVCDVQCEVTRYKHAVGEVVRTALYCHQSWNVGIMRYELFIYY